MIRLDETLYADDSDMRHILHRLTSASTDEKLRRDMEVEDEFSRSSRSMTRPS